MFGVERRRRWHIGPQVWLVSVEVVKDVEETPMGLVDGLGHSLSGAGFKFDENVVHCREEWGHVVLIPA